MKKLLTITTILLLLLSSCLNDKTNFHPELFSSETIEKVISLEEEHPSKFYEEAAKYYKEDKINEAALLLYIGEVRYRYYNLSNPDDRPDGDKAIFASLNSIIGSEIKYMIGEDFDNNLKIVEAAIEWVDTNEYKFYSKKNEPRKYKRVVDRLKNIKRYMINNKEEIIEERKNINTRLESASVEEEKEN